jgi:hypothetical protein
MLNEKSWFILWTIITLSIAKEYVFGITHKFTHTHTHTYTLSLSSPAQNECPLHFTQGTKPCWNIHTKKGASFAPCIVKVHKFSAWIVRTFYKQENKHSDPTNKKKIQVQQIISVKRRMSNSDLIFFLKKEGELKWKEK